MSWPFEDSGSTLLSRVTLWMCSTFTFSPNMLIALFHLLVKKEIRWTLRFLQRTFVMCLSVRSVRPKYPPVEMLSLGRNPLICKQKAAHCGLFSPSGTGTLGGSWNPPCLFWPWVAQCSPFTMKSSPSLHWFLLITQPCEALLHQA